jgi:ureidoglycolate dehydrogenase (NAD+)
MDNVILVPEALAREKVEAALRAAGADERSVEGATRAMMHASLLGVDSHGVRLTAHYSKVMAGGRVNPRPNFRLSRTAAASAVLDADDGLGHPAAYAAMELACEMARAAGIGAVAVTHSSHYGAAGAYARAAAEAGCIGFSTTNADSMVTLHGGAAPFHGTNPLAIGAPVPGQKPWLLDLATSSVPFNRVLLYKTIGRTLGPDMAADAAGEHTTDPAAAAMLLPLGGALYGYKGAGLGGLATLLSAVLTGTTLDPDFLPMFSGDMATPRNMGHFCLAIDPEHFCGRALYEAGIARYLELLRGAPAREGEELMAPGDREWRVEAERRQNGIPVDHETAAFLGLR